MPNYKQQAKKLQTKYLIDQLFKKEVDDRYKKYHIMLNESIYSDLAQVNEDLFVCYNRVENPIYFYFGMLQKCNKDNLYKFALHFIRFFIHRPHQDYIFVFINTNASSDAYGHFKQIFMQLTMDHFLHLKEFILLRPTYYHRAQDYMSFGPFSSHLRSLTTHFYNGNQLCCYLKMSEQDFVDIVPKQIAQTQFPNIQPRKLSLQDQRINFEGQLMGQHQKTLRKQFEAVMKSFLIIKAGKQMYNMQDYEVNKFGIPVVLQMLIFYFKTHRDGLREEGIFRKSVSIDQQNQTLTQLANKNYDYLLSITNPHIIANLIKRFFSNLKVPIIPYKQFEVLMHDQGVADKKQQVKQVVQGLPKINYITLIFLLQFLRDDVISNVAFNKMTAQNISICFAPCLLRAEKASTADIIYASKCAIVTRILIDNFDYIFGNSKERYEFFKRKEDIVSKNVDNQIQQCVLAQKKQRLSGQEQKQKNKNKVILNQQKLNINYNQNERNQQNQMRNQDPLNKNYTKESRNNFSSTFEQNNLIGFYQSKDEQDYLTPTASILRINKKKVQRNTFSTQILIQKQ